MFSENVIVLKVVAGELLFPLLSGCPLAEIDDEFGFTDTEYIKPGRATGL